MENLFDTLKRLHIFDRQVAKIERDLRELPKRLEEIDATFSGKRAVIEKMERRRDRMAASRKQKEDFLADEKAHLGKLEGRQMQLKTEKEMATATREIEASKKLISNVEDEVLRFTVDIEDLDKKLAELRTEVDQGLKAFDGEISDIHKRIDAGKAEIAARQADRKKLTVQLDPTLFAKYERVKNHQGFALAMVDNDLCYACHMHIPPQTYNLVQKRDQIQLCPSCHRILVMPDDELMEAERAVSEAEKKAIAAEKAAEEAKQEAAKNAEAVSDQPGA